MEKKNGQSIFDLIDSYDVMKIKNLIQKIGPHILSLEYNGNTPLIYALLKITSPNNAIEQEIENCFKNTSKTMLDRLVDIDAITTEYGTKIKIMESIILLIISYFDHCQMCSKSQYNSTPLMIICEDTANNLDMKLIAEQMLLTPSLCGLNEQNSKGKTALALACENGKEYVVKGILRHLSFCKLKEIALKNVLRSHRLCTLRQVYSQYDDDDEDIEEESDNDENFDDYEEYTDGSYKPQYDKFSCTELEWACRNDKQNIIQIFLEYPHNCKLDLLPMYWSKLASIAQENGLCDASDVLDSLEYCTT